jgi:predicted HTH transcriptional regulator
VATIAALARRAAIETLESAFGDRAARSGGVTVPDTAGKAARRAGRPRGGRGAKRTPADLEALSKRFASFVQVNPGLRIEQINKQLGTTTRDLALPIRKLVAEGVIDARGQRRSTTYIAGKKKAQN